METKVAGFYKTEHFLYRQWQRGVSDLELNLVLNKITKENSTCLIIVSRRFLKQCKNTNKLELFIKLDGKTLITCYYADINYELNTQKCQNYLLIN